MQNTYSFLVDLYNPGFSKKFKIGDGTLWEVKEHWSFLDNPNSDLVENLAHVIIIRQRNNKSRAYDKEFEGYPLEQTDFMVLRKTINDSSYWFSFTFREYDEHFRPRGVGSFQKILCKITFTRVAGTSCEDEATGQDEYVRVRSPSYKKRYDFTPLKNISSTDVKSISIVTVVNFLWQAVQEGNAEMKNDAIEFIVKNYPDVKSTESWREFSAVYPEIKEEILDAIIDDMFNQSDRASKVLRTNVSRWSVNSEQIIAEK